MPTNYKVTAPVLTLLVLCAVLAVVGTAFRIWNSPSTPLNPEPSPPIDQSVAGERKRCSTGIPSADERRTIERSINEKEATGPVERAPGSVTIPVHFHILKSSSGDGGVSETALRDQIKVLNDAFAGQAPGGSGAATPFRFELESVDETANDAWFNMQYELQAVPAEIEAKAQLNIGGKAALNIYTIKVPYRPFGWSRFPWDPVNVQGVVIDYRTLPGGTQPTYNEGDTATHEVGHWLGLYHTFENGCNSRGDEVEDTPPELGPTTMCPFAPDSCQGDGKDSIHNFMNFTNDRCMFQFTAGQARRMDLMHQEHRTEAVTSGR